MMTADEYDPAWRNMQQSGLLDGRPVVFLARAGSTNAVAMRLGREGARTGTLVVAEEQSKGRGRLGKTWLSPPGGGLYFSVILRPRLAPVDLPKITLAAGVAVCRAIERTAGLKPAIKWPNDILLRSRKCGGILTESEPIAPAGAGGYLVVLGIGLNVVTAAEVFPAALREKAGSIYSITGVRCLRGALLAEIVRQVDDVLQRLEENGFAGILAEWRQRDATLGATLTWLTRKGEVITGVSLGPDGDGLLHIRDGEGQVHAVLSGDISLVGR